MQRYVFIRKKCYALNPTLSFLKILAQWSQMKFRRRNVNLKLDILEIHHELWCPMLPKTAAIIYFFFISFAYEWFKDFSVVIDIFRQVSSYYSLLYTSCIMQLIGVKDLVIFLKLWLCLKADIFNYVPCKVLSKSEWKRWVDVLDSNYMF